MKVGIITELEEQRRDALVAYYLGQIVPSSSTAAPLRLTTPEDLYEYLLIDNQVNAEVDTSRVAQGIASLQQYIHAIYNGMEPGYPYGFSAEELRLWRESMSQYSVWAGYQMLEDYPENYIDPTLRLGKTSQFKTLENNLGQSRLTQDSVQIALKNYLSDFEGVSNLRVISGYIDGTDFRRANYYFVGRQNVEPFAHYWRKAAIDLNDSSTHVSPAAWSEWQPIDVAFESTVTHVRAVIISGRLHLVWVERGQPEVGDDGQRSGQYAYFIKMAYRQVNDMWSPATILFTGVTDHESFENERDTSGTLVRGFIFSVSMDIRKSAEPNLVVCFLARESTQRNDQAISQAGDVVLVLDRFFKSVMLSAAEMQELTAVAVMMFGGSGDRLQFPYEGIDFGEADIEWKIGEIVYDPDSSESYPRPPNELNQMLEFAAALRMLPPSVSGAGGELWLQGGCSGVVLERDYVSLTMGNNLSFINIGPRMGVGGSIHTSNRRLFGEVVLDITLNEDAIKPGGVWRYEGEEIGRFEAGSYKRVSEAGRGIYIAEVALDVDLETLPFYSPAEIQKGDMFEVQLDVGHKVTLSSIGNVCVEVTKPATRDFKIWHIWYEEGVRKGETLWTGPLTLNGGAITGIAVKRWTTADQFQTRFFQFGTNSGEQSTHAYNSYEVHLDYQLSRDVPSVVSNDGAQFLDLEVLALPSLRYVRLNTLFAKELVAKVTFSVEAVLSWETQHTPEPPIPGSSQVVPVDFNGANGRYFWELFFHAPHLVAQRLHSEFDYLGAETWYHSIFNPLARIQPLSPAPDADYPYWSVRPLAQPDRPAEQFFGLGGLRDPDAIAYSVPSHYRKAIFTNYLKNLIARGDMLYRQLTRDALNEAKLLYVRALSLLGPLSKGRSISRWEPMSLEDAAAYDSQLFSEFESSVQALFDQDIPQHIQGEPWLRLIDAPWFRLPVNTQLLDLWSSLELRLGNLRNNLTLDGKPLLLALYEAPANPFDLLRAQLAGEGGGARRLGSLAIIAPYRFRAMLPRVQGAVDTLIRFGDQVRSFMEWRDNTEREELLQAHVQELSEFGVTLQEDAVEQAEASKTALEASRAVVESRQNYYRRLRKEDISTLESAAMYGRLTSGIITAGLSGATTAANVLDAVMVNVVGTSGGTRKPAALAFSVISAIDISAKVLAAGADFSTQLDQYRRRREEWDFQVDQARTEIEALDEQLKVQAVVISSVTTALQQAEKARDQAEIYYDFLKRRATGPGLYQWLLSQMATLYFQAYDAVLSMCLATEAGWQYELGDHDTHFIPYDAWADNRHGLNAGEALKLGLLRMESAFLNRHERRLELTKTLSLKALLKDYDPNAGRDGATPRSTGWPAVLEQLKSQGEIAFHLNSSLFDKDYPGHYLRQVVGVSLSFPVVLGPYQDIHATLVQTRSSTLLKPSLGGVASLYSQAGELVPDSDIDLDPRHIVFNPRLSQQVGLSSGLDDYGLFTLNFDDERYLPFEGTGAVSSWVLNFPRHASAPQQEVFDSLTDIILQVRYLAVDGGKAFAAQVEPLVQFVEEQEQVARVTTTTLTVSTGTRAANGLDTHTATVTATDDENKPVEKALVVFSDIPDTAFNHSVGTTNPQGAFETTITSTVPGFKTVRATLFSGAEVAGSPKVVEFVGLDPDQSSLEMVDDNEAVSDTAKNNKVRATVRLTDGALAPAQTLVTFEAGSDISFSATTCRTVGTTGQCEVTLGSTVAKSHRISATLEGSLTRMNVNSTFVCGPYNAAASTLDSFVGSKLANGVSAHIATVTLRDRYGNPFTGTTSASYIRFAAVSGVTIEPSDCYFDPPGSASTTAHITSTQVGIYTIGATSDNAEAIGQPQSATFVAAPDLARSSLAMIKDNQMVDGSIKYNIVRATACMADGSPAPEGTRVTFEADSDIAFSASSCRTVGDTGQCEVRVGSTVAQTHTIRAGFENGPASLEVNTTFVPGALMFATLAPLEGERLANGLDAHVVTMTLRDRYGNPYDRSGAVVRFTSSPAGATIDPSTLQFVVGNPTVSTHITSEQAGLYIVNGYLTGATLERTQSARFIESPDLARLELEMIDDHQVVSDTAKNNKVRAKVVMKDGSLVPEGTRVNFEADSDIVFSATSCQTVGDTGQCEVTLGCTVAKTHTISARVEMGHSSMQVDATFVAGAYDLAASSLEPIEGTRLADGMDAHVACVTLRDAYGNPYTATTSTYVLFPQVSGVTRDPARGEIVPGSSTTSTRITSTLEGSYSIRVTSETGVTIGQPQLAMFAAPSADESRSTFSVSDGSRPADGVATHTVRAFILDAADRPFAGATVYFGATDATLLDRTCVTGTDGTCSVQLVATTSGTKEIRANLDRRVDGVLVYLSNNPQFAQFS
ncbi:Ig-like domain-containing protein [Pseudomonas gingeri]|uniref:Tc toxin subunit A-related protein n=1 Tax=Pseudomonas gingeri TaxID=117681 RepID=UPI0015A18CBD|nr:Ig-like domain-containing protein [Pseudomonas gingeri]NWD68413.1 Ig-like domain-containing protein [Pseudomonas gingeri]